MPDPFRLQSKVLRRLVRTRPSFEAGLTLAIEETVKACKGKWTECHSSRKLLQRLPDRWTSWFNKLTRRWPPPNPTRMLWFEFPSELNPALSSVSGFAKLDPTDELFGMEEGRNWPRAKDDSTRSEGLLELPELDDFLLAAGWKHDSFHEDRDLFEPGYFCLSSAIVVLLVLNELPRTDFAAAAFSAIGVLGGAIDGDPLPLGLLTAGQWQLLRSQPHSAAKEGELDPTSWRFDLKKYLGAGGDPNWKDPQTGETLLQRHRYRDAAQIDLILRAGGNPRVPSNTKCPTLFFFGAAEVSVLSALVAAGADPNERYLRGHTLLEWIAGDGRCTTAHLDWSWKQAVRCRSEEQGFFPLHIIGGSNVYERGRLEELVEMAKWWVARGFTINSKNKKRLTPLGYAVVRHAIELDEEIVRRRRSPDIHGLWDYQHDRVAEELLKLGADPNVTLPTTSSKRVPKGGTPLMVQRYDSPRLVEALLRHGADPTLRCARGRTALDYARLAATHTDRLGHEAASKVVTLLERAVAGKQRRREKK